LKAQLDITHAKNPELVERFVCIACKKLPKDAFMCGCKRLSCRECIVISTMMSCPVNSHCTTCPQERFLKRANQELRKKMAKSLKFSCPDCKTELAVNN